MTEPWCPTDSRILLGVLAGLAVIGAFFWALRRAQHGADGAVSAAGGKHEGLLNKDVVAAPAGGQAPEPDSGDVPLCAICKARLADAAGWGPCRRLRPCGHVYHAECIGMWLERKWICPVCRAGVVASRTEIIDAMV
ncbi:probable E3 ubiquitin-protein ligase ATL44 [Phragmites australis]|uniref:probable E3 ubiquitin-protein ligase ATL44 n=1 Tax=Phragmites australis TaxID=29695 RepID=UPI002D79C2C2|nr:probable E3 ubiquitin-protein ligase ATL44 [Phragmites australis]